MTQFHQVYTALEDAAELALEYIGGRGTPLTDEEEGLIDEAHTAFLVAICAAIGAHEIVDDQCMNPGHRYCVRCMVTQPHGDVS